MAVSMKKIAFWNVAPCSVIEVDQCFRGVFIALMAEAACTSETSVHFSETVWLNILAGCLLISVILL
jgi:hypothetical protein